MEHQVCTKCEKSLPINEFSWRIKAKGIRQQRCKTCSASLGRWYREQRREILGEEGLADYEKKRYKKNRYKQLDYHRHYYQRNKEDLKAKSSQWYANNREQAAAQRRIYQLRSQFGLTPDDYEAMVQAQDGRCALCQQPCAKLHVDHCHTSGRIRGLLCVPCNVFLGRIHESVETLERMIAYLLQPCEQLPLALSTEEAVP